MPFLYFVSHIFPVCTQKWSADKFFYIFFLSFILGFIFSSKLIFYVPRNHPKSISPTPVKNIFLIAPLIFPRWKNTQHNNNKKTWTIVTLCTENRLESTTSVMSEYSSLKYSLFSWSKIYILINELKKKNRLNMGFFDLLAFFSRFKPREHIICIVEFVYSGLYFVQYKKKIIYPLLQIWSGSSSLSVRKIFKAWKLSFYICLSLIRFFVTLMDKVKYFMYLEVWLDT